MPETSQPLAPFKADDLFTFMMKEDDYSLKIFEILTELELRIDYI